MKRVLVVCSYQIKDESTQRFLSSCRAKDVFLGTDEWEVQNHLKNNKIDAILFDPSLSPDVLEERPEIIREEGEVGLILLNNIKEGVLKTYIVQPKLILFTALSESDLKEAGFPAEIPYLKKPASVVEIMSEINKK